MSLKPYIASLLVLVFLAKLLTVDAQLSNLMLESSGITMVKKACVYPKAADKTTTTLSTETKLQDLAFDYLCHSVFDLKVGNSPLRLAEDNFRVYPYQAPVHFPPHGDKFYPPPKA